MAAEKRGRGRPRATSELRSIEVYVRMSPSEAAALDSLVELIAADLPGSAGAPSRGSVLRELASREVVARGLDKQKKGAKK